jgi:polygalacturonase
MLLFNRVKSAMMVAVALTGFGVTLGQLRASEFDPRTYGALGDGVAIDSQAINRAIEAAAASGGGTVCISPGVYACYSLRLRSNVELHLDAGATLLAADPTSTEGGRYDPPESNEWDPYQDFGHSHWHNSLIWGENLQNVSITGHGRIDGRGLSDGFPPKETHATGLGTLTVPVPANEDRQKPTPFGFPNPTDSLPSGVGNKAIALKSCRNVTLRDFTIFRGGHFGLLLVGVDDLTIDNLAIDTDRDGMDIDACRNVRITGCLVNSPWDDGICLKSSFGIGPGRSCDNVTIANCQVSGYDVGALLDGTYRCTDTEEMRRHHKPQGRIKLGTESNGGFRNIAITNCTFDHCRGLALESVDGAKLEDVIVSNLTMRDVSAPIFVRLGARLRGPKDTTVGTCCRIKIDHVIAHRVAPESGILILGLSEHPIEELSISDVFMDFAGGGTKAQAALIVPELADGYPEAYIFGVIPAWALFARHVRGLDLHDIAFSCAKPEQRPATTLIDVKRFDFDHFRVDGSSENGLIKLRQVEGGTIRASTGLEEWQSSGRLDAKDL